MMPPQTVQSVRPSLSITITEPAGDVVEEVADGAGLLGVDRLVCTVKAGPHGAGAVTQRPDAVQGPGKSELVEGVGDRGGRQRGAAPRARTG